jgi:hypothetical protein
MNRHHPSLANHDQPERESPGHDRLAAWGMPSMPSRDHAWQAVIGPFCGRNR